MTDDTTLGLVSDREAAVEAHAWLDMDQLERVNPSLSERYDKWPNKHKRLFHVCMIVAWVIVLSTIGLVLPGTGFARLVVIVYHLAAIGLVTVPEKDKVEVVKIIKQEMGIRQNDDK